MVADDDDDGEGAWRRDDDREQPRSNVPEPAPQPKTERVDLAALAKDLSEVRDSAGFVACYNRHRITEGHPDYTRPSDTADKINYRKMTDICRASFLTGWKMANEKAY